MSDEQTPRPEAYTGDDPLVLPARLIRRETYSPWWSDLIGPLRSFVSMLPSHKSTRKGRRSARQFRIVTGAILFAAIVFSPSVAVTLGAIALFVLVVPWLPLPEVRKRAWTNRLTSLQQDRKHTVTRPGRIVFDGRRVKLDKGGNTLRRVLTDRDDHEFEVGVCEGRPYLRIAPKSGRKSDTIWVGAEELDAETLDEPDLTSFSPDAVDRPALTTSDDWRTLLGLLRSIESP